jgi:hypothetical protein
VRRTARRSQRVPRGDLSVAVGEVAVWSVFAPAVSEFAMISGPMQIVTRVPTANGQVRVQLTTNTNVILSKTPFRICSGRVVIDDAVTVGRRVGGARNRST